ncbi:MAG: two pore domain potassium channel family protein [Actinobacteria bacterium]|uniref:Unannotated protein n=1 Tax=freshwater metagenome TaxID=449393 RepID=A0A6J7E8W3_9ZZZZ|nr:two pore domain potassium channel family protein [Actinomycetota bacterium]
MAPAQAPPFLTIEHLSEKTLDVPVTPAGLSTAAKAKLVLQSGGRTLAGLVFVWLMIRLVPVNPHLNLAIPIVLMCVMIAAYAWYFKLQLRRIHTAQYPQVQATEALILVVAMFLAIFSVTYYTMSLATPKGFSEPLDQFSAFYFAVTVLATVGFGDITPVSIPARSVAMLQMGFDIAFIAVAVRIVSGTANKVLENRQRSANE